MSERSSFEDIPRDLQEQFYELAEEESKRLLERLEEFRESINIARKIVEPYIEKLSRKDKDLLVGAVDGSSPEELSERLGIHYYAYSTCLVEISGKNYVGEPRFKAYVSKLPLEDPDLFKDYRQLKLMSEERELAAKALKNVNLMILDGSFFGYVFGVFRQKKYGRLSGVNLRLAREITEKTLRLAESGKCIAVVKRARTKTIGCLVHRRTFTPLINTLDKYILNLIMPEMSILEYSKLLGRIGEFRVYNDLSRRLRREEPDATYENSLKHIEDVFKTVADTLGNVRPEEMLREIKRIQVKIYSRPPFELEVPIKTDDNLVKDFLSNPGNFNPKTNLPFISDLVDYEVGLPRRFSRDFTDEIEARIIEKIDKKDLDLIRSLFAFLNPQKEL